MAWLVAASAVFCCHILQVVLQACARSRALAASGLCGSYGHWGMSWGCCRSCSCAVILSRPTLPRLTAHARALWTHSFSACFCETNIGNLSVVIWLCRTQEAPKNNIRVRPPPWFSNSTTLHCSHPTQYGSRYVFAHSYLDYSHSHT